MFRQTCAVGGLLMLGLCGWAAGAMANADADTYGAGGQYPNSISSKFSGVTLSGHLWRPPQLACCTPGNRKRTTCPLDREHRCPRSPASIIWHRKDRTVQ